MCVYMWSWPTFFLDLNNAVSAMHTQQQTYHVDPGGAKILATSMAVLGMLRYWVSIGIALAMKKWCLRNLKKHCLDAHPISTPSEPVCLAHNFATHVELGIFFHRSRWFLSAGHYPLADWFEGIISASKTENDTTRRLDKIGILFLINWSYYHLCICAV